jgi:hypothetical protein
MRTKAMLLKIILYPAQVNNDVQLIQEQYVDKIELLMCLSIIFNRSTNKLFTEKNTYDN